MHQSIIDLGLILETSWGVLDTPLNIACSLENEGRGKDQSLAGGLNCWCYPS